MGAGAKQLPLFFNKFNQQKKPTKHGKHIYNGRDW